MGLRSWLTPLAEPGDWVFFKKAIRINPDAYGIHYVIEVTADIPLLQKGIWVAWSGDCTGSLTKYMPACFVDGTILIDNLLDEFPAWHEEPGPERFGTLLASGKIEKRLSSSWEDKARQLFPKTAKPDQPLEEATKRVGRPGLCITKTNQKRRKKKGQ